MSSSFSIEISGDGISPSNQYDSGSSVSEEFDVTPSEPSSLGQPNHWSQPQRTIHGTEAAALSSYAPVGGFGSSSHGVEPQQATMRDAVPLEEQLQQERADLDPCGSAEDLHLYRGDVFRSAYRSREGVQSSEYQGSGSSEGALQQRQQLTPQKQWSQTMPAHHASEIRSPLDDSHELFPISAVPLSSARATASPTRRVSSTGHPYEGILKRRTEKWTEQSTMGEDVVVRSQIRLWLAPGSVLWRFFVSALAARIGSCLALLVVVLTTLGRMGKAVSCVDISNCVGGGGIMAFPVLLRTLPNFGAGIVAYEAITESLVAGLVLMLLPMVGNCYFTCQALLKGTKKAYLEEVRVTTCCTAWVGACVGVFIPPAFFTEQFCDPEAFDVNAAYRDEGSPIEAASRNMCDQVWFARACVGVALLCVCSTALLLFQRYSRLWAALLGLGCLKFMFAGFLLCFTILFGGQGNEMMLETMDTNSITEHVGLHEPMVAQIGLLFASLKWGGYILAISNLACGAFTIWAAHLRSHLLACTNLVANFVFFFVNAVAFCAMLFEFATLRMVCNYPEYPMEQSDRARAEAAFFCSVRPQFLFLWLLVALMAITHLIEFFLSGVLFHQEFGRSRARTRSLISVPSMDSLPPKWGAKR